MSTLKFSLLLSLIITVSACSQVAPFEDRRREPGTELVYVGASKPGFPAICYNPLFYDENDVKTVADKLCQKYNPQTEALKRNDESFSCRLLVPSKAFYECVTKK